MRSESNEHLHSQLQDILSKLPQYIQLSSELGQNLKWSVKYEVADSSANPSYGYIVEFKDEEKVLFDVHLTIDADGQVHIDGGLSDGSLMEAKPSFRLKRLFVSPEFKRFFKVRKDRTMANIYRLSSALNIAHSSKNSVQDYFRDVIGQISLFMNVLLDEIPEQRLAL